MPDSVDLATKWNTIYSESMSSDVASVLRDNAFLLPESGRSLDLACGLGANALFLARRGLESWGWDISSVALHKLQGLALEEGLNILTQQCFIEADCLPENTYDVIIVSRFLDRTLSRAIMHSLTSGGLLFYQTYMREKRDALGPKNPDFLLARNELLDLFQPLHVLFYQENGRVGQIAHGERNEALFIGQKKE